MTERLTGITGSMFAGKTAELLRLVERARFAGQKVQVFKPIVDNRWGKAQSVRSHAGGEIEAVPIKTSLEILEKIEPTTQLVAIDEVQFFDSDILKVVQTLLEHDIHVIIAGLPLDFRGEPFGSMPTLLAMSDRLVRLSAICTYRDNGEICGQEATRTQRLIDGKPAHYNEPIILVGAEDSYAARCPTHHIVPGKSAVFTLPEVELRTDRALK